MPRLTPEQLASRKLGMGATDVVEALGLSPYEGAGPMRLFLRKTQPDLADDDAAEGDWLEWGHIQEPVILAWYERATGNKCVEGGHVPSLTDPWLWATLDASVMGESRIVEVKHVGSNMARHWDAYAEDGIPRYVRAQVTIGMYCSGKRLADVVASVGGRPPHVWTVEYDPELAALLVDGARAFWRNCEARVAPPLDATPATKDYLRRKYPADERAMREAVGGEESLGTMRAAWAEAHKKAADTIAKLDAQLLEACADAKGIQGEGWKMTWKLGKDGKRRQRFTVQGEE